MHTTAIPRTASICQSLCLGFDNGFGPRFPSFPTRTRITGTGLACLYSASRLLSQAFADERAVPLKPAVRCDHRPVLNARTTLRSRPERKARGESKVRSLEYRKL